MVYRILRVMQLKLSTVKFEKEVVWAEDRDRDRDRDKKKKGV